MDQASAAMRLDLHPVTLSRYETGARRIPDDVRERMAQLYGLADGRSSKIAAAVRALGEMREAAESLAARALAAEVSVRAALDAALDRDAPNAVVAAEGRRGR